MEMDYGKLQSCLVLLGIMLASNIFACFATRKLFVVSMIYKQKFANHSVAYRKIERQKKNIHPHSKYIIFGDHVY
jgi:hypothetical protein